ncbi:hypothetical protein Tco_0298928 [Tanacetum coccineum]
MSNDGLEEKVDAIGEEVDECQTRKNSEPVVAASRVNGSIKESEGSGIKGKENVMDKSEIRQESNTKEAGKEAEQAPINGSIESYDQSNLKQEK